MFLRTHRVGRYCYTEAVQSYRDPKPLVRWRAGRSFVEELASTRLDIEQATREVANCQAVIDRSPGTHQGRIIVSSRRERERKQAQDEMKRWQRSLGLANAHYTALTAAREAGLPADDAEIEKAAKAEAERRAKINAQIAARITAILAPLKKSSALDVRELTAKARTLVTENDPRWCVEGYPKLPMHWSGWLASGRHRRSQVSRL